MRLKHNNAAYIDGANLHKGVQGEGWELDYARFRIWLRERFSVQRAFMFIGLVPKHKDLYTSLQEVGYTLVFKETTRDGNGNVKGNCDADLVLRVVRDAYEEQFDEAIIVSSDGDYASLVKFLLDRNKCHIILSPASHQRCSVLLKRTNARIAYLDDQRAILQRSRPEKKKPPAGTISC